MKKVTLLFAMMLMGLTSATAKSSVKVFEDLDITSRYRYTQPIVFVERGVEFLIFADGSFDFNTDFIGNSTRSNQYYRNRRGINRSFGAPGTQSRHFGRRGVLIRHDHLGRVRRVGNVFVNYDRHGRIKRAGSVYMQYRRGFLRQVGNLRLNYNGRGRLVNTKGRVNFNNPGINSHFNTDDDWYDNDWDINSDDDFYYYRQGGKLKKQKN